MAENEYAKAFGQVPAKQASANEQNLPLMLERWLAELAFQKEGQYFLNQTVYIDDYTFIKCRFDNCNLVTFKGTFKFKNCVIDGATIVSYGGEALKIVKLFNSKSNYSSLYPNFLVQLNTDGTFTIE